MWDSLPPEVFSGILKHLQSDNLDFSCNDEHDACVYNASIRLVCREWRACFDEELRVLQPRVYHGLRKPLETFSGVTTLCFCRCSGSPTQIQDLSDATTRILRPRPRLDQLRNVCMRSCAEVTDRGLTRALSSCTGLTRLDLSDTDKVTFAGVASLVRHNTGLTELNLKGLKGLKGLTFGESHPALTHLNVSSSDLCDADLKTITGSFPNLTRLDMNGCSYIRCCGIFRALRAMTTLRHLEVHSDRQLIVLPYEMEAQVKSDGGIGFPALTHVHLNKRTALFRMLQKSGCLPQIVELATFASEIFLFSGDIEHQLTGITTLITTNPVASAVDVIGRLTTLTDLRIKLQGTAFPIDEELGENPVLNHTLGELQNLERLTVLSCSFPGITRLLPLRTLKHLTHLTLIFSPPPNATWTQPELNCWLLDLPSLRVVVLSPGEDLDLMFATLGCIKTLESVSIESPTSTFYSVYFLDDAVIAQLAGLDRLEELNVRQNSSLTKEGLHRALGHLRIPRLCVAGL